MGPITSRVSSAENVDYRLLEEDGLSQRTIEALDQVSKAFRNSSAFEEIIESNLIVNEIFGIHVLFDAKRSKHGQKNLFSGWLS